MKRFHRLIRMTSILAVWLFSINIIVFAQAKKSDPPGASAKQEGNAQSNTPDDKSEPSDKSQSEERDGEGNNDPLGNFNDRLQDMLELLQRSPENPVAEAFANFQKMQERNRLKSRYEKTHRHTLSEFKPLVVAARSSTVRVEYAGKTRAYGTIVSANGYFLSKLSEAGDAEVSCRLAGKKHLLEADFVRAFSEWDLGLYKLKEENDYQPIQWAASVGLPQGTILAASGVAELPVSIGVLSVLKRSLNEKEQGFLGVGVDSAVDGVRVSRVTERSAAEEAGLQVGDVISAIDGKAVRSFTDLLGIVSGREPGENVELRYRRGDEEHTATAVLKDRFSGLKQAGVHPPGMDVTAGMGTDLSRHRNGYPAAIQHDLTLAPSDCGGPLVNLDGKAIGINIARAGRVMSYAIPQENIQRILSTLHLDKPIAVNVDIAQLESSFDEVSETVSGLKTRLEQARGRKMKLRSRLDEARRLQEGEDAKAHTDPVIPDSEDQ